MTKRSFIVPVVGVFVTVALSVMVVPVSAQSQRDAFEACAELYRLTGDLRRAQQCQRRARDMESLDSRDVTNRPEPRDPSLSPRGKQQPDYGVAPSSPRGGGSGGRDRIRKAD